MKILFSSDLHGEIDAYKKFSKLLKSYDCGVLAGDLMDEMISLRDAESYGLINPEEPEELLGAEENDLDVFTKRYHDSLHDVNSVNRKGLEIKKNIIIDILNHSKKPIFYITGNHDIANWIDQGNLLNIELKKVIFMNTSFVGYSPTNLRSPESEQRSFLANLIPLVDKNTILVSHSPPYGILDTNMSNENIGSRALRDFIKQTNPMINLFGHVHERFGRTGNFINGSWFLSKKFVSINTTTSRIRYINANNIFFNNNITNKNATKKRS